MVFSRSGRFRVRVATPSADSLRTVPGTGESYAAH
jgi:hypothetical protein